MKRLTCEMCGSSDMLKEDGVFVCQSCGCKYSVEEARKLMIDGPVDVTGSTVKIDKSNEIENRIKNIKNEYNNQNYEVVKKMCIEVCNIDVNNYEAILYGALAEGWQFSIDKVSINLVSKELTRSIKVVRELYDNNEKYTELCILAMQEIYKLSVAMVEKYLDYSKEQKNILDNMQSDATIKGLDLLSCVGSSRFYDKKREVIEIQENAKKIDKELIKKYNQGVSDICLAIYSFAINVMEHLPDCFDENKKFYAEVTKILEFKSDYLSKFDYIDLSLKFKIDDSRRKLRDLMQERKEKIVIKYWENHTEEKANLELKLKSIEAQISAAANRLHSIRGDNDSVMKGLQKARNASVPSENDRHICKKQIKDMQLEYDSLGVFKWKEKKVLSERIDSENCRLKELERQIRKEKQELISEIDSKIDNLKKQSEIIRKEISELKNQEKSLRDELENPGSLPEFKNN